MDLTKPQLSDGVVTLRPWRPQDAEALLALCQQESVLRWRGTPECATLTMATLYINYAEDRRHAGKDLLCAVVDEEDKVLGACDLRLRDDDQEVGEVAYALSEDARGQGVMTRALRLMCAHAFEELQIRRLEAFVHPENTSSRALLLRVGFTEEGRLRAFRVYKDRREDRIIHSLLATD